MDEELGSVTVYWVPYVGNKDFPRVLKENIGIVRSLFTNKNFMRTGAGSWGTYLGSWYDFKSVGWTNGCIVNLCRDRLDIVEF